MASYIPLYDPTKYGVFSSSRCSGSGANIAAAGPIRPEIKTSRIITPCLSPVSWSSSPSTPASGSQDVVAWAKAMDRSRPLLRSLRKSPVLYEELLGQLRGLPRMEVEHLQAVKGQRMREHQLTAHQL